MERVHLWVVGNIDGKYQVKENDYVIDDDQWLTFNGARIMYPFSVATCESLGLGYHLTPRAAYKAAAKDCAAISRRHLRKAARKLKQSKRYRKLAKKAGFEAVAESQELTLPFEEGATT